MRGALINNDEDDVPRKRCFWVSEIFPKRSIGGGHLLEIPSVCLVHLQSTQALVLKPRGEGQAELPNPFEDAEIVVGSPNTTTSETSPSRSPKSFFSEDRESRSSESSDSVTDSSSYVSPFIGGVRINENSIFSFEG